MSAHPGLIPPDWRGMFPAWRHFGVRGFTMIVTSTGSRLKPGLRGRIALLCCLSIIATFALEAAPWTASRSLADSVPAPTESTLEPLDIVSANGTHRLFVEVMRDDAQRARGLMFRRFLPADRGMLFDFKREEPVSMWMKNTYLPLDMLFIDHTGKVISIAENTEPMSERIIPSGGPVLAVLEVNAGTAERLGIKAGDRLRYKMFR
ncbi:MAG: uncharacterized protein JWL62_1180 [Hyphomicrobiales bacterium]|nr:uncharacterized protein [Hyphomicrobiales bacterium]